MWQLHFTKQAQKDAKEIKGSGSLNFKVHIGSTNLSPSSPIITDHGCLK
tara:strand:- start:18640 stop:18786 length:147 start_codon:yes stop_codon:yes gene_type:complete